MFSGAPREYLAPVAEFGEKIGIAFQLIDDVIDLSDQDVETDAVVAGRVRRAFDRLPPEQLVIAPDCGMKYLPRAAAEGKMRAMAGAAALLRTEL